MLAAGLVVRTRVTVVSKITIKRLSVDIEFALKRGLIKGPSPRPVNPEQSTTIA